MSATNNYKKWTAEEDDQLVKYLTSDENYHKYEAIAHKLHRTVDAVQARFVKLAIVPKYTETFLHKNVKYLAIMYNLDQKDLVRYFKYAGLKDCHDNDDNDDNDDCDSSSDEDEYSEMEEEDEEEKEEQKELHKTLKLHIDVELNILDIIMMTCGSMILYYFYPTIIRSI